jgi:hypothetical protein
VYPTQLSPTSTALDVNSPAVILFEEMQRHMYAMKELAATCACTLPHRPAHLANLAGMSWACCYRGAEPAQLDAQPREPLALSCCAW